MRKLDKFIKALTNFHDIYTVEEPYSNLIMSGVIKNYELCFELAWKSMKEILEDFGYSEAQTGSPKHIIKLAYRARMITDEDLWIEALNARNDCAHSYNEDIALRIIRDCKSKFYQMFKELQEEIVHNWISV